MYPAPHPGAGAAETSIAFAVLVSFFACAAIQQYRKNKDNTIKKTPLEN